MTTCFLFARSFEDDRCLSLRLDQEGHVDAPLEMRSIQAFKTLQHQAQTMIVLPTEWSSLHEVELPWLGDRKARSAIPYALEEQLAQNVATLHFSFDRQHHQHGHYLVVVTDKSRLVDLIQRLDQVGIDFDRMTLDWFALKENEACLTADGVLCHDDGFKGGVSGELAAMYLRQRGDRPLLVFKDSLVPPNPNQLTKIDQPSSVWLAQRLLNVNSIHLCQGELQHDTRGQNIKRWYWVAGALASILVLMLIVMKALYLHALNVKISALDDKIAGVYRTFFPEAKQVISPKFRVEQWLKSGSVNQEASSLWTLLGKFAEANTGHLINIQEMRFQGRVLSVTLQSKNFSVLEKLQQRLQQANIKVTQSQATSQKNHVLATLELSL